MIIYQLWFIEFLFFISSHVVLSDLCDHSCSPNSAPQQRQSLTELSNKRLNCGENRAQAAITCEQPAGPVRSEPSRAEPSRTGLERNSKHTAFIYFVSVNRFGVTETKNETL